MMRLLLVTLSLAALLLAAGPVPAQDPAPLVVGGETFHRRTLDNGLRAVAVEAPGDSASVFMVVGAGKRQETPETNGLAHLTEHAMYTGTATTGPDEHDRIVKGMGGQSNAFTREDYTLYYDHLIPENELARVLGMEADRLRGLAFPESAFYHERDRLTHEEEKTWEPSTALDEAVDAAVFRVSNYRAGVLDSTGHTLAPTLTLEDARAFYDAYYHPDHVAVVVVSARPAADALDLIQRAFGGLPRGPRRPSLPVEPRVEEPRTEVIPFDLSRDRVEAVWLTPPYGDPDHPALQVLARVLSRRNTPDGTPVSVEFKGRTDADLLRLAVAGHDAAAQLEALLVDLRLGAWTEDEVSNAREAVRDLYDGLPLRARPYFSLAAMVGVHEALGVPEALAGHREAVDAVTAAELRRVARRYLDPRRMVTVHVKPNSPEARPLPEDPKALADEAQNAEASGDYDRAIEAYTRLLEGDLSTMYQVIYLASRGQIYMEMRDYDTAIADFEAALAIVDYPAVRELLEEARRLKAGGED